MTLKEIGAMLLETTPGFPAWQPIDTAPKDGTRVLGLNSNKDQAVICWDGGEWIPSFGHERSAKMWNDASGEFWSGYAMYWVPLPPPLA